MKCKDIENLKNKIIQYRNIFENKCKEEKENDVFIKHDPKNLRYIIFIDGEKAITLTIKDLKKLELLTGEEPFIRFYFAQEKDIWKYFQEKEFDEKELTRSLACYAIGS